MESSYELLDFGNGERLEQWGDYRLIRPDPTATGVPFDPALWEDVSARYEGEKGKGGWTKYEALPESWPVMFDDVCMIIKLAPYKHTGAFPEQLQNWRWMRGKGGTRSLNVLNVFAYTGGATMALAKDGHFVTHVDASKPAMEWAKENAVHNELPPDRIRWILDDAAVFAGREIKRGKTYDAIVIDPPAFGHSPSGKTWRVERDLAPLLEQCVTLLSAEPAFLVLNGYAHGDTSESFHRLLKGILHAKLPDTGSTRSRQAKFSIDAFEVFLGAKDGRRLSTGVTARCQFAV